MTYVFILPCKIFFFVVVAYVIFFDNKNNNNNKQDAYTSFSTRAAVQNYQQFSVLTDNRPLKRHLHTVGRPSEEKKVEQISAQIFFLQIKIAFQSKLDP